MRRRPTLSAQLGSNWRRLGAAGQRVVLAVSGGADSLALLYGSAELAPALGLSLEVATVDHGARAESAGEARSVEAHAGRLGLPFHLTAVKVAPGAGFEARARAARYGALEAVRQRTGAALIATAHTASDQAETVLMRLLRGSAARGARGILERAPGVVRPLLTVTRAEVEAYLAALQLQPALDPMNADERFFRVAVRRRLIPLAEALAPGAVLRLASFAEAMGEDDAYLEQAAIEAEARLRVGEGWDATGMAALAPPLRRRVIAALLRAEGAEVDRPRVLTVELAIVEGRTAELTRGVLLHAEGGWVRVERAVAPASPPEPSPVRLALGQTCVEPRSGRGFSLLAAPPGAGQGKVIALARTTPLPLEVRTRRPGDRVARGRKLQDVLVDAAIPAEQRDLLPVVTDAGGRIVWVPGVWPRRPGSPKGEGAYFLMADDPHAKRANG